jgi:metal-responsive CopG/Arc/MetJ family transcriptional regulator
MTGTTITTKSYNEDRTEKLGITLPAKLLQKIEHIRGDVPRSKFIRRAVEGYIQGRWREKWELKILVQPPIALAHS